MPAREFKFGFLPHRWNIYTDHFQITPLSDFDEGLEIIRHYLSNRGSRLYPGYVDPPVVSSGKLDIETGESEKIPGTERGAHMWHIRPSHQISMTRCRQKDPRLGDAAFIVHFIAFLAGTRLQFEEFRLDSRTRLDGKSCLVSYQLILSELLNHAYIAFKQLSKLKQYLLINSLYILGKSRMAHFEWEQFSLSFMALDALWKLSGLKRPNHSKIQGRNRSHVWGMHTGRIYKLAEEYSLEFIITGPGKPGKRLISTAKATSLIVMQRNNLLHECRWGKETPGFYTEGKRYYNLVQYLDNFISKLVIAILTGPNKYSSQCWTLSPGHYDGHNLNLTIEDRKLEHERLKHIV